MASYDGSSFEPREAVSPLAPPMPSPSVPSLPPPSSTPKLHPLSWDSLLPAPLKWAEPQVRAGYHAAGDALLWAWDWGLIHLAILGVILWLLYKLPEWIALIHYLTEKGAAASWAALRQWHKDRNERREWQHYSLLAADKTQAIIAALRHKADWQSKTAVALEDQGQRVGGLLEKILLRRAGRRRERARIINEEAERIETLTGQINTARKVEEEKEVRGKVPHLVNLLASSVDSTAAAALAEFNKIAALIDWESLVPANVPDLVRARLIKMYRQMAGTDQLGEARAAKQQAELVMQAHNFTW